MFDQIPLHPIMVHFPIALILTACAAELVGAFTRRPFFTKAALLLLVVGALGAVAAYITGDAAGDGVEKAGALKSALEAHEDAATFTLWVIIGIALVRSFLAYRKLIGGWLRWGVVVMLLVGVAAIGRTGYLGGELVFKHAAGVQMQFSAPNLGADSTATGQNAGEDRD